MRVKEHGTDIVRIWYCPTNIELYVEYEVNAAGASIYISDQLINTESEIRWLAKRMEEIKNLPREAERNEFSR